MTHPNNQTQLRWPLAGFYPLRIIGAWADVADLFLPDREPDLPEWKQAILSALVIGQMSITTPGDEGDFSVLCRTAGGQVIGLAGNESMASPNPAEAYHGGFEQFGHAAWPLVVMWISEPEQPVAH